MLRRTRERHVGRRGYFRSHDRLTYDRRGCIRSLARPRYYPGAPNLVIDLGVAREVVVVRQLESITARAIVGGNEGFGNVRRPFLMELYSLTTSGTSLDNILRGSHVPSAGGYPNQRTL